jgi:hypothetical protein
MACGGKCTITEYQYAMPVVESIVADTPDSNCAAIPNSDPEALQALQNALAGKPSRVPSGCDAGCHCRENTVQLNTPRDRPATRDNVPWESDSTQVRAPLRRGECNYTVHGKVELRSRILDGHCKNRDLAADPPPPIVLRPFNFDPPPFIIVPDGAGGFTVIPR